MEAFFGDHQRHFESLRFVYPVISRRAGGLSLGINLNSDKACNFDCPYCQVDRKVPALDDLNVDQVLKEVDFMSSFIRSGKIFAHTKFACVPKSKRGWMDVSIAGDGEPSISKNLLPLMQGLKAQSQNLPQVVLLSNATGFSKKDSYQALEILADIQGAVWAKLDAGSQEYFKIVSGSPFELEPLISNIKNLPKSLTLKIQTCFMYIDENPPLADEIQAYRERILEILKKHEIDEIQIYTIARQPSHSHVKAMKLEALKNLCSPLEDLPLRISYFSGAAD